MDEYRKLLRKVYPQYSDEQIEALVELRVEFWR